MAVSWWDQHSEVFADGRFAKWVGDWDAPSRMHVAQKLTDPREHRIVDLGCGTAEFAGTLAALYPGARDYTGVDASLHCLRLLMKRGLRCWPADLSMPDDALPEGDVGVLRHVLEHVGTWKHLLARCIQTYPRLLVVLFCWTYGEEHEREQPSADGLYQIRISLPRLRAHIRTHGGEIAKEDVIVTERDGIQSIEVCFDIRRHVPTPLPQPTPEAPCPPSPCSSPTSTPPPTSETPSTGGDGIATTQ